MLERFGAKVGLSASDTNQRNVMLGILNEAAQYVYEETDIVGSLVEDEFYVAGNQRIAMPKEVYAIRAMREKTSKVPWKLTDQRAEYQSNNWISDLSCWRIIGYSPIKTSLSSDVTAVDRSSGVLTAKWYNDSSADEKLTIVYKTNQVNLTNVTSGIDQEYPGGSTDYSISPNLNYDIEDIISITRSGQVATETRGGKIQIIDTNTPSIIYAELDYDEKESRYLMVDVSEYPWDETSAADDEHTLQVLYKKSLKYFNQDTDMFPAPNYENIIVTKMMQLWLEEQGKHQEAVLMDGKVSRDLGRRSTDLERGQIHKVQFHRNPHDNITNGVRIRR
tara:strand:+ start:286 stop:1287 length:1002 start_codon:yes stop_codon:yes gene_type:complete